MNKIGRILKYIFLTITSIISIFPFIWMIIGATNKSVDITKGKFMIGENLKENMMASFTQTNFPVSIINSTLLVIIITVVSILVSSLAGYSFEMFQSKVRNIALGIILLSMMIPFAGIMIPLYKLFGKMGLLNTYTSIILPSVATGFLIFFFKQNTKSFSKEIVQAARIDGLTEIGIFFRVYIPTMKSTYAAAGIITFMATWNNYMWPLIALQTSDKQTIPIVLAYMGSTTIPDYGMIMFSLVIATLPSALVFFILQHSFVQGMVGSVKG